MKDLTFTEHLEEFRRRVISSLAVIAVGFGVAFYFSEAIISYLTEPLLQYMPTVYYFSPTEGFMIRLKAALAAALLLTSPFTIAQLWLFVSPAMYAKEKKIALFMGIFSSGLFITGVWFAFEFVVPAALQFLLDMSSRVLQPMISVGHYMDFLWGLCMAFGVAFNLPLVILTLSALGILSVKTLYHYQRHAIVVVFLLAAILTPGPDVTSQLFLAVPLLILFEFSVLGSAVIESMRARRKASQSRA